MSGDETIADVFCGAGGMSDGFGNFFDVTLAVDHAKDPCDTYRTNLGGVVRQKDVRNISGRQRDFDGIVGMIGGAPCKPFSRINTRKVPDDPRQHLWKDFMRLVEEVNPMFYLFENVPTIFAHIKKGILRKSKALGYYTTQGVLETADYGVPQARKRWIVIGTRKPFAFPKPTHLEHTTVRDAFAKIDHNDGYFNTRPETLAKLASVPVGKWVAITSGGFRSAIRLSWNQPSPTIVNVSKIYMIHPEEPRVITEREAAVLQGFPSSYDFKGAKRSRCQQIADAAPSRFMKVLAQQIHKTQFGGA
jgi:DNA (cytosine-5)-methyltransferase 1